MAAASPRNPRRTKGRHRKPSNLDNANCAQWLRVGTVGIGLGAAIASGQAVASAAPDDSSGSGPAKEAADTSTSSASPQAGTTGGTPKKAGPKRPPTTKVSGQSADGDTDATGGSKADSSPGAADADNSAAASATKRTEPQVKAKPRKISGIDAAASAGSAPAKSAATADAADAAPASAPAGTAAPSSPVTVSTVPAAAAVTATVSAGSVSAPGIFADVIDALNGLGHGLEESLASAVRQVRSSKTAQAPSATTTSAAPPTTSTTTTATATGGVAPNAPKAAAVTPISPQDAVATLTAAYSANNSDELIREAFQAGLKTTDLLTIVLAPVINAINLIGDLSELSGAVFRRDGVDVADEIGDVTRDLIGMVPVVGQPIASALYNLTAPPGAAATEKALAAAAAAPAAAGAPAVGTAEWYFQGALAWAVNRLAGWPGTPQKFIDITNYQTDQTLDQADTQLQSLIDNAIAGSPARWVPDLLGIFGMFFQSAIPGYTFTNTLNAWGDFLNRIVPPFTIASGAGTFGIITPYKIMGAAVAGTATVLADMLNGVYDPAQWEIDVIKATTGATVTRSDLTDQTSLTTKIAASVTLGDGGAFSHPERAWSITLPTWTAQQVNPFTVVAYVALVGIYKRFQEMAALQNYTLSTTYDSWLYTLNLGGVSSQSEYAAGTFHAVDQQGRTVDFFGVSQGGTYTSQGGGLVTINTADGGFTYTNTLPGAAFFHRATSENPDDRYDTVYIPVKSADGVQYTLPFKIQIINGTNAAPTATSTAGSGDGLGVVRGTVSGSDSDGDTLKYTLVGSSVNGLTGNSGYTKNGSGNGGIVTLNQNTGAFTYASSATAGSTQSFQVQVTDGHGGSTVQTVTVTNNASITPANVNTSTQNVVTGSVPVPSGDSGMFTSYALGTAPSKGTVTSFDPVTGAFTYVRNSGLGHTTPPGDVVTVLATDANGRTVTLNLAVTPTVANASPTVTLTTAPTVGTLSGTTQTSTGKVTYSDPDGDAAVWPSSVTTARGGTVTFAADGTFTYTSNLSTAARHAAAKVGAAGTTYNGVALAAYEDAFTVTVGDGYGGTAQTTVKVPIYAINAAPTTSGSLGSLIKNVTTVGAADGDGDSLSYTISSGSWTGTLSLYTGTIWGPSIPVSLTVKDGYYKVTNGVVDTTKAGVIRTWSSSGSGTQTDAPA